MQLTWNLIGNLIPALLCLWLVGWLLWHWLKASDEPLSLIVRWLMTVLVMGYVMVTAARAKDEISKVVALLIGCVGGLIMAIVWREKICDAVANVFGSLYTGGKEAADPTPFYSIANAKRKQGKYSDAIDEVHRQLDRFPNDFTGWMLLAEIYADDLKDLAGAQSAIQEILGQEGHAPKNVAYALNREADWHLKLAQDREGARAALERIVELLPETEQALQALQRISHLTPPEMLEERVEPRRLVLTPGQENIGLRDEPLDLKQPEEDPAETASKLVNQLEAFPFDCDAREKLALIYARHYQRLDLASDQLEQLVGLPNQPPKQVVHWLNLLADLQIELTGNVLPARETLQRIIERYPNSAAAATAGNRIAHLKLELRPKLQGQTIKLGAYEQNIGLKGGPVRPHSPS